MNEISKTVAQNAVRMTSLEIAQLVGKRHDNVRRTIETLAEQRVIEFPQIEEIPTATKPATVYVFPVDRKRDTYVVVAQLSPEFTARLVDRWQELEAKPALDLSDPASLRGALLTYTEKVIALESQVNDLAPKATALDAITASPDSLTFTQASKVLGIKRNFLIAQLHATGWIYRQNGSWVAYDQYIKNGCLVYKEAVYTDEKTEMQTYKPYCHLTQKGLTRLAGMLGITANLSLEAA